MVLGPGKIFGTFFAIAALIVAVTTVLTSSPQIRVWYDPKQPEFSVIVEPKIGIEWMWLGSLVLLALLSFKYLDRAVIRLQIKNKATG